MKNKKILMYIAIFVSVYAILMGTIVGGFYLFRSKPNQPDAPKETDATTEPNDTSDMTEPQGTESDTEGGESIPPPPSTDDEPVEGDEPITEPLQTSEGLKFSPRGNQTVSLTGMGMCRDQNVVIPERTEMDNLVVSVESRAFTKKSIVSVTVPDSVTQIGEGAFSNCYALESVSLPVSLTSIEAATFFGCSALEEIVIPHGVTMIQPGAFWACSSLVKITLPDTIAEISELAFVQCPNLQTVYYQGSIEQWNGWYGQNSLPVGCQVFCTDGVIPIESGRQAKEFSEGLKFSSNGDGTCSVSGIGSCTDANVVIPYFSPEAELVVRINDKAFAGLEQLQSVVLPHSVSQIGESAFADCISLTDVTMPKTLEYMGNPFQYCDKLTKIVIPEGIQEIKSKHFSYCTGLVEITIPKSVRVIHPNAFYRSPLLERIYFPGTVAEWKAIYKIQGWRESMPSLTVYCNDGEIRITGDSESIVYAPKGLAFTSNGDGTCTLSGIGTCIDTDLRIPLASPSGEAVVAISDSAFFENAQIQTVYCMNLQMINFDGTMEQWNAISKGDDWRGGYVPLKEIRCIDGIIYC